MKSYGAFELFRPLTDTLSAVFKPRGIPKLKDNKSTFQNIYFTNVAQQKFTVSSKFYCSIFYLQVNTILGIEFLRREGKGLEN